MVEPPRLRPLPSERLRLPINYATAAFERREAPAELDIVDALALFSSDQPVSVAAGNAIEDDQWLITLMGYDDERPGRTAEDFRRICAVLPPFFQNAVKGRPTREIVTYRQADSRRRDFTTVGRFPGRLVAIGDAVASFNPVYAQGMSSAALQRPRCPPTSVTDPTSTALRQSIFFAFRTSLSTRPGSCQPVRTRHGCKPRPMSRSRSGLAEERPLRRSPWLP